MVATMFVKPRYVWGDEVEFSAEAEHGGPSAVPGGPSAVRGGCAKSRVPVPHHISIMMDLFYI